MTTIYLSSTYEDLKDYRSAVFEALRKAGNEVLAMEDYVATDRRPVEKCLAAVARADIYVGLFAFRYGYVPPAEQGNPDSISITELEFRRAEKLRKPCLAFAVSEDAPWPPKFIYGLKGERINRLREYLITKKTACYFSSPHQLASLVQSAVTQQIAQLKQSNKDSAKNSVTRSDPEAPPAITWDIEKDGSPYPGLMHFTSKYSRVFFGREVEVAEILGRMFGPEGRFTIISGDSGVGKSSVVAAGILPKVKAGALSSSEACDTVRMLPGQGGQPFPALMMALGTYMTRAGLRPDAVIEDMKRSAESFVEQIRKITSGGTPGKQLVLFVDQMEELFTAQDAEESNRFLTALYRAAQEQALWVIATIRSDHLHYCQRHDDMLKVLKGSGQSLSYYPLGRVVPYMMKDMIMKPAMCGGLKISDRFAQRIVNDTLTFRSLENSDSGTDSLPLMAFVLERLFLNRSGYELSEKTYDTMGGISGAIADHVKKVERDLQKGDGTKSSDHLEKIFHSLANVKEEGQPTRNRPLKVDFPSELYPTIDVLVNARLLRTEGEGKSSTISISHETLFEAWPALRDCIAANKQALMDQTLLNGRARKWVDMGKPWFRDLASGRDLKDLRRAGVRTPQARSYLSASNRAWWMKTVTGLVLAFVFGFIARAWQKGLSVEHTLLKLKSMLTKIHVEPEMVIVKPGIFRMGSLAGVGDDYQQPAHDVTIQKPFKLGKYEVTFDEYDRFALTTGRSFPGDQGWGRGRQPVINVSWRDAAEFARWLSAQTGKRYRLPTEAEWEYSARSGGKDEIWAGTSDQKKLPDYAIFSASRSRSVGGRKINDLKLHDMSGNVWEWVEDCWHSSYNEAPSDGRAWKEENGGRCGVRVIRGGSWGNLTGSLGSVFRAGSFAVNRDGSLGFRLAQDIE